MARTTHHRTLRLLGVLLAMIAAVTGCSSGDETTATTATPTTETSTTETTSPPTTLEAASPPTGPGVPRVELTGAIAPDDGFDDPSFVAIDDASGRLIVTDSGNGRLVSLALDGTDAQDITAAGDDLHLQEHGPLGSADVAADGTLLVAESGRGRVVHLSTDGTILGALDDPDGYGRLFSASVDRSNGVTYAVDDEKAQIVMFGAAGTVVGRLGGPGDQPGQLDDPGSVEVADDGTLWVADAGNGRVQHLAQDGDPIVVIGPFAEDEEGYVEYPNDVAIDHDGRVWAADHRGGGVVAYQADGRPIGRYAADVLTEPVSLAFDDAGRLYVTDWSTDQVHVFTISSGATSD
jgi:sugar lactone lactonase YvrE